ncbi:hypothetical protein [Neopusillimonas aromaticivorans]|uniref:hypothetical protein n=1 Tax=Neopusillimonas aromaticivorans TaxID=2979868 RepID=UPI002596C50A|nr:hypothetical protein [Neopusillimonas aromaticivorans]WJJ92832.1 hypothetical protein N7E01_11415 [Neopusillimonas aromaticivorans]
MVAVASERENGLLRAIAASWQAPQLLSEDGCWRVEGDVLVLQTLNSNGSPVEADDPIYTNHYQVVSQTGRQLRLRGPEGAFTVGRMPDNYRLPF